MVRPTTLRRFTKAGEMATFTEEGLVSAARDEAWVTRSRALLNLDKEADWARRFRVRCEPTLLEGSTTTGRPAYLLGYRHDGTCCHRTP